VLQTLRNVAIVLALAAVVDFLPGGGAAAATVMAALTLIFMAAIAWFVYRLYREQQLTLSTLTDPQKAGLFGAVGGIALLVVAYDEFSSWSGGVLLWIALIAGCVGGIALIWRSASSY
jgi:hypothetical protein